MITYILSAFLFSLLINMGMFLLAFTYRTDKLTDISYAVTFATLGVYGLLSGPVTLYRCILFVMIVLWSIRLGSFLLYRVSKVGKDTRFDDIRENFWKFGRFWLGQALAVWVILLPSLFAFTHDASDVSLIAIGGAALWSIGLVLEACADWQKFAFTSTSKNKGKWIQSGLWRYSRHPNYMGEILVWIGVYIFASTVLLSGEAFIAMMGPLFIIGLLLFVSGVPVLEKSADKRWGSDPSYRRYKKNTSILVPLPPRNE